MEKLKEAEEKAQDALEKVKNIETELISTHEDNQDLREQLEESNKSCEQMKEQICEVENGVENLQRRMSTSLGKDMVANSSETLTSMGASMEVTNETYDSLGKNVNLRKRSLGSPEGGDK